MKRGLYGFGRVEIKQMDRESSDTAAEVLYGMTITEALERRICVKCRMPAGEFTDNFSRVEYDLEALCQKCQDTLYGSS